MAEAPAFPLWTDAYLADTGHLTTLEHGAYFLLLMAMWRAGGTLPNDDKKLARFAHLTNGQWARIRATIMSFFAEVENGQITQWRLIDELEHVRRVRKKQSDNARAKHRKDNGLLSAVAVPNGSQPPAPIPIPPKSPTRSARRATRAVDLGPQARRLSRRTDKELFEECLNRIGKGSDLSIEAMTFSPEIVASAVRALEERQ